MPRLIHQEGEILGVVIVVACDDIEHHSAIQLFEVLVVQTQSAQNAKKMVLALSSMTENDDALLLLQLSLGLAHAPMVVSITNISVILRRCHALLTVCSPGRLCGASLVVCVIVFFILFFNRYSLWSFVSSKSSCWLSGWVGWLLLVFLAEQVGVCARVKHDEDKLLVALLPDEEGNPKIGIDDDLHTLLGVSYGSNLVHDFIFADGRGCGAAADEAVKQLLAGLGLPAELANKLTEQRPVNGWHVYVNALCCSCTCHNCILFIFHAAKVRISEQNTKFI